jgi:hypothetical protein
MNINALFEYIQSQRRELERKIFDLDGRKDPESKRVLKELMWFSEVLTALVRMCNAMMR